MQQFEGKQELGTIPVHLKLSQNFVREAKAAAIRERRTTAQQIEYWARIGRITLENPDMPICLIMETLHALAEVDSSAVNLFKPG